NRLDQSFRLRRLHHDAARAELQRTHDFTAIDTGGEQDGPNVRDSSVDSLQREKPGPVRRTEVEQQDVRLKLLNQLYRFLAVSRLACDPQIGLRLEQLAEAFTKEREVGGDYDPNCISRTS